MMFFIMLIVELVISIFLLDLLGVSSENAGIKIFFTTFVIHNAPLLIGHWAGSVVGMYQRSKEATVKSDSTIKIL